jgi:hypothetical protein
MAKQRVDRIACALALTAAALSSCAPAAGSQTTIGPVEETRTSRLQTIRENLYPDTMIPPRDSPSRLQLLDEVLYPTSADMGDCRPGKRC